MESHRAYISIEEITGFKPDMDKEVDSRGRTVAAHPARQGHGLPYLRYVGVLDSRICSPDRAAPASG